MSPMRTWLAAPLIAVGGLWLLDAAGVLSASDVIDQWWPAAVIAVAVVAVISERRIGLGPAVVFVVGVLLLLDRLDVFDVGAILWPAVAVVAGVWLVVRRGRWSDEREGLADRQDVVALLGASSTKSRAAHFRHANVSAVFGGATLDLRDAHLEPGARVEALAVFGGVDVIAPEGWRVSVHGLPIFGGFDDKTHGNGRLPADAPMLDVAATAIFGGVGVKNPAPVRPDPAPVAPSAVAAEGADPADRRP